MDSGIQPVMNMNPYGGAEWGGGDGLWLFALLILFGMGGFGGFGYGRGVDGRCATVEDLNNSANFTRLESQVMNNGNRIEYKADAVQNGICNLGYEMAQQFSNTRAQLADCCCGLSRSIDGVNYNGAINTASINANTTAQIQKVLDALAQDKIEALQGRINQLELQQAVCGVVRYPTSYTYNAGASPFCGGGYSCGCGYGAI